MPGETGAREANAYLRVREKNVVDCSSRPLAALQPGEIRLRAEYTMVSPGTELHHIAGTHTKPSTYPRATGYIAVSRVEGFEGDGGGFALGQRVLGGWGHSARSNVAPAQVLPIPEGVDPVDACCVILLGISLRGVRAGQVRLGDSVAVFGLGLIGAYACHLAKVAGGHPVIGIDPMPRRREIALALGADAALDPTAAGFKNRLAELTCGEGPFVAMDATGTTRVMPTLFEVAAEFGRVVVLGGVHGQVPLDLYTRFQKSNLTMVGCGDAYPADHPFTVRRNHEVLLRMIASGQVKPRPAVTHVAPWRQGPELYRMLLEEKDKALGVAFDWSGE
ncbi:MAG: zinc-binding alcohol dehydrogenase [Planctomycetota bacterium]|nr:zinc-binding alcohol dehydrogenase [Planctomycetota bacterium]